MSEEGNIQINRKDIKIIFGNDATEVIKYLDNKNRGGVNNQKGNNYESFFAVYKLATSSKFVIENNRRIDCYSQIWSFVDDLIIHYITDNFVEHYQLKNSSIVLWGSGLKSIAGDFKNQYDINNSKGINSSITLVVSNEGLKNSLQANLPNEIIHCSNIEYFSYAPSLIKVIENEPKFKEAIEYLCAFENPDLDKIECVANVILGAWISINNSNPSVLSILIKAQSHSPSFIRAFGNEFRIDKDVAVILNNISNFTYEVSRKGFFTWSYGNGLDEGILMYSCETDNFKRFQDLIRHHRPANFEELEKFLMKI